MYVIIIIAIIAVFYNFNTSCNTLRIAILDTLKTEILNSVTFVTYKLRDVLFTRNKAIGLPNT